MVMLSRNFQESNHGTPIWLLSSSDFAKIGARYDDLRLRAQGLSLTFFPTVYDVAVLANHAQPLTDGAALEKNLGALSNSPRHCYLMTLGERHLAILVDYTQRSARRGGEPQNPRYQLMETLNGQIKSITVASDVYPVSVKGATAYWQWSRTEQLAPEPAVLWCRPIRHLVQRLAAFVQAVPA